MSLDEEIAINQFGQRALSEADMLSSFTQMDVSQQRKRFVRLYLYVTSKELTPFDIDQALADCSLTAEDPVSKYLNLAYLKAGSRGMIHIPHTEEPPEGDLTKPYTVMLHVFRANYERRYAQEKDNSTKWWYRDFSKSGTAKDILDTHRRLAEEIYANASYRSEFRTMAKLWHTHDLFIQASHQDPPTDQQTHFNFIGYDQIGPDPGWIKANQSVKDCALLHSSVDKALCKQYGRDIEEIRRLTLDVINRHMQETYSSGLYDF